MEWLDGNKIQIIPPKRPKKLTGTRFATILGLNPWSTPFEIWCEVTRTYQKPFEDTIYTIAGKTIEPKQAEYMKQTYFMSNLVTPTDIWGKDYFRQTYGDFFICGFPALVASFGQKSDGPFDPSLISPYGVVSARYERWANFFFQSWI